QQGSAAGGHHGQNQLAGKRELTEELHGSLPAAGFLTTRATTRSRELIFSPAALEVSELISSIMAPFVFVRLIIPPSARNRRFCPTVRTLDPSSCFNVCVMRSLSEKPISKMSQDLNSAGECGLRASTGCPFAFLPETARSSTSLVRSSPTTQITAGSLG